MTLPRSWLLLLACALAFLFLGSRGLYDPDEGRYTNVALNMLDSGDWINPQRNEDTGHWTKPPLTYWAIAGSVELLGKNTWAARVPSAFAFLVCAFACWRAARRLAPGAEDLAALAYLTMLLPAMASQLATTDFLLSAFQALAMLAFVEWRFTAGGGARRWIVLMWAAFALAFLTKGPPALLPLLVLAVFGLLAPGEKRQGAATVALGVLVFAAIALPWFLVVTATHPGLMGYFLGREVVDRVASGDFARHAEWYGWAEIYLPTLLLGTLPWTWRLLRWARGLGAALRGWRERAVRAAQAPDLLLALWVALPLLVFCLARSRLPLYLLPLAAPLALVVARQVSGGLAAPPRARTWIVWAAVLVALRLGSALVPNDGDASAWAREIAARVPGPVREVAFVEDMPRYGLRLYLGAQVKTLSLAPTGAFAYNPEFDAALDDVLASLPRDGQVVLVTKAKNLAAVSQRLRAHGLTAVVKGAPWHKRVVIVPGPPPA